MNCEPASRHSKKGLNVEMVEPDVYFGDDFGQKIDLTVRIREILRNYPGRLPISNAALRGSRNEG